MFSRKWVLLMTFSDWAARIVHGKVMDAIGWTALGSMVVVLVAFSVRNFNSAFNSWYYKRKSGLEKLLSPWRHGMAHFRPTPDPNAFTNNYTHKYGRAGLDKTHLFGQAMILATTAETVRAGLMGGQETFTLYFQHNCHSHYEPYRRTRSKGLCQCS